jgi:hypothetical protein
MADAPNQPGNAAARTGEAGCLPPGYRLHEFVIERVLGEGGFGVVYAATDTRLERRVAIKEYMPTSVATRDTDLSVHPRSSADHQEAFVAGLRSFVNEAKLLARFEHPSLVKVYQFWEERGTAYMVMPLYTAPTFKRWVRERKEPIDEGWLVTFLDGLIDAIDALHKENCLHRDVAPDNVLVLNESSPLLLDFGAARRVIGDLTHNLTVILKPGFAPVEQYAETAALKQGPWTDVYALSAVGYFAITGKAPMAAVARIVNDDLVPLRQLAAGRYSTRLLAALDAGLAVRPEERPLSMTALRAHLFGEADTDLLKSTIIAPKAPPAMSAAPNVLHSTFKPAPDATAADEERTRAMTTHPARVSTVKRGGAPTVPASSAPTVKLPPRAPAAARPQQPAPQRRSPALLWAGLFAAAGTALVLGGAWWLGRSDAPPAPAGKVAQPPQPAPSGDKPMPQVDVLPAPPLAAAPSPAPITAQPPPAQPRPAPAPVPALSPPAVRPAPPETKATDRSVQPVQPAKSQVPAKSEAASPRVADAAKKAPPQEAARPAPSPVAPPVAAPSPTPVTQVAEAAKAEPPKPPVFRAPEGPPPYAVSDTGITALQAAGTVNLNEKEPLFSAYTCCNLHYSGDWVSDLNYSSQTRIPAGTPVKVTDYGRYRVITEIGGKQIRLGLDYGRRDETLAQYARKLTVDRDLRFRIGSFPPVVQDAIRAGKLLHGMSKEQVVIAVGFPARHETASVNAPVWKFWHTSRASYLVRFDEQGRVKDIEAEPSIRANVIHDPAKP